jgi:hypothetical protein
MWVDQEMDGKFRRMGGSKASYDFFLFFVFSGV